VESPGQKRGVGRGLVIQGAGETAPELGKDHPGITAGAHQSTVGDGLGDFAHGRLVGVTHRVDRRLHGQGHIRPGVPIRHREDVQGVDELLIGPQPREARFRQLPQDAAVDDPVALAKFAALLLRGARASVAHAGCSPGLSRRC
jgi:hypothetical protein